MLDAVLIHAFLCLSAVGAGVINALAGGGTLLSFPALLWALAGRGAAAGVLANATSTVALVPGSLAGAWGYRRELAGTGPWLRLLFWPSLAGGLIGSGLLIVLPDTWFQIIIPWLLLTAALLFLVQPALTHWLKTHSGGGLPSAGRCALLVVFQFLVAVYGGYFGAGIGILMLTALALMGLGDLHRMNTIKTLLAAVINGVSVLVLVVGGKVEWAYAPVMAVAAIAGGYFGAHFGRRLPATLVRWTVILIGFGLAAYYFWRQASGAA